jgi:hypothetical protein
VKVVLVHDPGRRPASWTGLIRPGQFVAFARDAATGVPCDQDGRLFQDADATTCLLFDSFDEARTCCERGVASAPAVRFDIFDAEGRANPPLLTVLHPSRAAALDTHPGAMRRRGIIAWALAALGLALIVFAYVERRDMEIVPPAFIGINMILVGARLLWMNLAVRETERTREDRVAKARRL